MAISIYIGPAGWSYPDWNGIVYPSTQSKSFDPLKFISFYFNLIEINNTFYRIPSPTTARRWVKRVSDNPEFLFTVKASRNFSHGKGPAPQTEFDAFKKAISPIYSEEKLGFILVQFPWSFRYSRDSRLLLGRLIKMLSPFPVAVEVRHGSWENSEAIDFLRETGATLCGIDQPLIGHSLTPKTHLSGPSGAYFRLHGRNASKWFGRESTRDERYNYLYSEKELSTWAVKISETASNVHRTFVVLNNHFQGQAVVNALELKSLLSHEKTSVPSMLLNTYPQLRPFATAPDAKGRAGESFQIQGELFNKNSTLEEDEEK